MHRNGIKLNMYFVDATEDAKTNEKNMTRNGKPVWKSECVNSYNTCGTFPILLGKCENFVNISFVIVLDTKGKESHFKIFVT